MKPACVRSIVLSLSVVTAACGSDPAPPAPLASVSGVVRAVTETVVAGATVKSGSATTTTDAAGQFELNNLSTGVVTLVITATDFDTKSHPIFLVEGENTVEIEINPVDKGECGTRKNLLVANSEFALAQANGKIFVMGGYPFNRVTSRTVQIYDIATDTWSLGPDLPQPNNHGMAAAVNGKIYLLGGQVTDDQEGASAVATVY